MLTSCSTLNPTRKQTCPSPDRDERITFRTISLFQLPLQDLAFLNLSRDYFAVQANGRWSSLAMCEHALMMIHPAMKP